ncbi:MAG: recombination mediator RecR [Chloroflexota bacterium]|jgi:recombination protein RecR
MLLPEPIQDLVEAFSRLPGIGPKTASRLTFFLLHAPESVALDLAEALQSLRLKTANCQMCFNITSSGREHCEICADGARDHGIVCVVEDPLDVIAIEKTSAYRGLYHVLQGVLSPITGVGPENLRIKELMGRVHTGEVHEVILATNPSLEGDATAMYLRQQIAPLGVHVTRLARGLPMGGDLEYADQNTLLRALTGRQEMN